MEVGTTQAHLKVLDPLLSGDRYQVTGKLVKAVIDHQNRGGDWLVHAGGSGGEARAGATQRGSCEASGRGLHLITR